MVTLTPTSASHGIVPNERAALHCAAAGFEPSSPSDVFHLPLLPRPPRGERVHRIVPGRPPSRVRPGAGTALGGLRALHALEPDAARGAVGGDRAVRADLPRDEAPRVERQHRDGTPEGGARADSRG